MLGMRLNVFGMYREPHGHVRKTPGACVDVFVTSRWSLWTHKYWTPLGGLGMP